MSGEPFPKSSQLARGERRYRRKVASPKQWQAIMAAKIGPCRVCVAPATNGGGPSRYAAYRIQAHHLVPRGSPHFGDDVADNIVPVCPSHHDEITRRDPDALRFLAESLTEAERAYVIGKRGNLTL